MLSLILIIVVFISLFFLFFVKEPVYSVFCFILILCGLVGLLFLLNVEYIALMFILIYIGAIVVLFLFVTMLLNLRIVVNQRKVGGISFQQSLVVVLVALVLLKILLLLSGGLELEAEFLNADIGTFFDPRLGLDNMNLISVFSTWLYNFYAPILIIASFILLIALVGSILLTSLKE